MSHIRETRQLDEKSVESVATALERFEVYTRRRDYREHRPEQAVAFKRYLSECRNKRTGEVLSRSTILSTFAALRHFFAWLADRRGYRSRLNRDDADYFKASLKDMAKAKAPREKLVPSIEDIKRVVDAMPTSTSIELRDRALVAFTILTGARDDATASFLIKHVDVGQGVLHQCGNEARTKFSKSFSTWFFPVLPDFEQIVAGWIEHVAAEHGFGPEDPLFPATDVSPGPNGEFVVRGFKRQGWSSADPIRAVFRAAFARVGLPYSNPHVFRDALVQLGYRRCRTPESIKAWSQNLGHEKLVTTLTAYGQISADRQREIIRELHEDPTEDEIALELGREILRKARRTG